jgi:hypothetical protein
MALLKRSGTYGGSGWEVDLGDDLIKSEMGEQLRISDAELSMAINMENLTDKLFARILKNRSKAHQTLLEKIPGAKD